MSAFMCEPDTIRRISKYLAEYFRSFEDKTLIPKEVVYAGARPTEEDCFFALVKFNKDALCIRYDDSEEMFWDESKNYRYEEPEKPIEDSEKVFYRDEMERIEDVLLYENLQCYIYQVSEGECEKNNFYQVLVSFINYIARKIVETDQTYKLLSIGKKAWR